MNPQKGIKYIRTSKGPKTKEQIIQEFQKQNPSFPLLTLPYEHIIQNITEFLNPNNSLIFQCPATIIPAVYKSG